MSEPVRCRREQSYIVRATLRDGAEARAREFVVDVMDRDGAVDRQRVLMQPVVRESGAELLGWFDTFKEAHELSLRLDDGFRTFEEIVLRPVAECPAVSHPAANISDAPAPSGADAASAAPMARRVLLPTALASLAGQIESRRVELLEAPVSIKALCDRARGAACVLSPEWIAALRMKWADVQRLAEHAWVIVDLESAARLLASRGVRDLRLRHRGSNRELPCASVRYADAATQGFALSDAFPYAVCSASRFGVRFLSGGATWRSYADEHGFATLLGLAGSGDPARRILCAAMPTAGGELIASDLPWLAAGLFGPLAAPRLACWLLNAQLGGPREPRLQYWTPTREPKVLLREVAELQRHYPALLPVRWAPGCDGVAHLGLALRGASENGTGRGLLIQTGRMDRGAGATSFPPEAMMSLMKLFARERRDRTAWARERLGAATIVWQFDVWGDSQFRHVFESAGPLACSRPPRVVALVDGELDRVPEIEIEGARRVRIDVRQGVLGDGSFEYQRELLRVILAELSGRPVSDRS